MNMPVVKLTGGIIGYGEPDTPDAPEGVVLGLVPAIEAACGGEDLGALVAIYLRFPSDDLTRDDPWETGEEPPPERDDPEDPATDDESSGPIGEAIDEALFSFSDADTLVDHVLDQRPLSYAEHDTLVAFAEPFAETVFGLRDRVLAANPAALGEAGAEGRDYFLRRVTAEIAITLFDEVVAAVREYRKGLY